MSSSNYDAHWTFAEAQFLLDQIRHPLKLAGFGIGLTGSVLSRGESDKDIDVIVYPLTTAQENLEAARAALTASGLTQVHDRSTVTKMWRRMKSKDEKHVEVWEYRVRRVDVFFLR